MPLNYAIPVDSTIVPKISEALCVSIGIDLLPNTLPSIIFYYESYDAVGNVVDRRQAKELLSVVAAADRVNYPVVYKVLKTLAYSPEMLTKAGYPAGGVVS